MKEQTESKSDLQEILDLHMEICEYHRLLDIMYVSIQSDSDIDFLKNTTREFEGNKSFFLEKILYLVEERNRLKEEISKLKRK